MKEILEFVAKEASINVELIHPDSDLDLDLGITGDDFHEFIDHFSERFDVNIENYLWYFHTSEEGYNLGGFFFRPPNKRVKHIPVTPNVLLLAINEHEWPIIYPKHVLPKRRMDIYLQNFIVTCYLLVAISFIVFIYVY